MVRGFRYLGIFLRAKDDLGQAFTVAQVNENDAAVIAPRMHPAGEFDLLADVGGAQGVAVMGAIHGGERRSVSLSEGRNRASAIPMKTGG